MNTNRIISFFAMSPKVAKASDFYAFFDTFHFLKGLFKSGYFDSYNQRMDGLQHLHLPGIRSV